MQGDNDLTKLARWIIPGWIAILSFIAFILIDMVVTMPGHSALITSVPDLLVDGSTMSVLIATFSVAAAGVPIGFSVYQIYFFLRWNSPFSRDGLLPPVLPGRMNDLDQTQRDLTYGDITLGEKWRQEWINHPLYKKDHSYRARYNELLFIEASQKIDTKFPGLQVYLRHRFLDEVMHTLGASIIAIYMGFNSYLLFKLAKDKLPVSDYLLITLAMVFTCFILLNFEYAARNRAKTNPSSSDKNDPVSTFSFPLLGKQIDIITPGSLFIFSLLLTHFLANPRINPSYTPRESIFKIAIAFAISAIWVQSKGNNQRSIKRGDVLVLGTASIIALIMRLTPFINDWIDWRYYSVLTAFLISNLVLFHNRQNAKEQMFALEYYTLRRFITEKQDKNDS